MKKFISLFLILTLSAFPFTTTANDEIAVTIDGEAVIFNGQPPVNINGRILVPARGVFEMLGFVPTWDGEAGIVTLTRYDYTIIITIGSDTFTTVKSQSKSHSGGRCGG